MLVVAYLLTVTDAFESILSIIVEEHIYLIFVSISFLIFISIFTHVLCRSKLLLNVVYGLALFNLCL